MINKYILRDIGLSENETEIYLIILDLGEVTVYEIANQSKMQRPNIYDTIKKLREKGLVSSIKKGKKIYFKAVSPEILLSMLKTKESNLLEILPELIKTYETKKIKPLIEVFEGFDGLKRVMEDMIKEKTEIWIFSGAEINSFLKKIPDFQLKNYLKQKEILGIKTYILYSKGIKPISGPDYKIKELPYEGLETVSYMVYRDRIVIGIWSEIPIVIRIIDENVSRIWKIAIKHIWNSIK